jgi:chromate transporter
MVYGEVDFVTGILYGIRPAVVAIVAYAVIRIGEKAIKTGAALALAIMAFCAIYFLHLPFPWIILSAGVLGFIGSRIWPAQFTHLSPRKTMGDAGGSGSSSDSVIPDQLGLERHMIPSPLQRVLHLAVGLALWFLPMAVLTLWEGWQGIFTQMGWFFTKAALLTFGGAYAVLPYVAVNAIDHYHWLRPGQMIDGLALGETTPGPLIMVVTFVGFVGAWQLSPMGLPGAILGGLVATYFTFLPSFLFILLGAPVIEASRGELKLSAFLSAITAAVVGVVLNLALFFGQSVFLPGAGKLDGVAIAMAGIAFLGMWRWKWPIVPVVIGSGLIGLIYRMVMNP